MVNVKSFGVHLQVLARREIEDMRAAPAALAVSLAFAVGFVIVNNGVLGSSAAIAREVGGSYLAFVIPSGVLIATVTSGAAGYLLAQDHEDGYFERLLTMSVSRTAIVLAPILASGGYALVMGTAVICLGVALGAFPVTGILGMIAMVGIAALWGMGVAGYMTTAALLSRRLDVTRIVDLFSFPLLGLAPIVLPRADLQGWMRTVATANPTTYVLEGVRALMVQGWSPAKLAPAIVVGFAFACVALGTAILAARHTTSRR